MTMFPIDIDFSRIKEVLTYDPQAPMIFSSGIFLWLFTAFLVVYVLLTSRSFQIYEFPGRSDCFPYGRGVYGT